MDASRHASRHEKVAKNYSNPLAPVQASFGNASDQPQNYHYQKRHRTTINQYQLTMLEEAFKHSNYPSLAFREALAFSAHLNAARVQIWFQNGRVKQKKHIVDA